MRGLVAGLALLPALLAAGAPQSGVDLPADLLPPGEVRAVALEAGTVRAAADATAPVRISFEAGRELVYYGATTDAFGRPWSIVGDPGAWARVRTWLVLPEVFAAGPPRSEPLAFLEGLGAPATADATTRRPVRVAPGWFDKVRVLSLAEPPQLGEPLGVPAYRVPAAVLQELKELIGGDAALGPWPAEPAAGQLYIPTRVPIVYVYDGGWRTTSPVRALWPALGLLRNPTLTIDPQGPLEMTGGTLPCWRLAEAIDAAGKAVGRVVPAPAQPATIPAAAAAQGKDALGVIDFTARAWPTATEDLAAPRRVLLDGPVAGVLLEDNSSRRAVYLEQALPEELVRKLWGREVRLDVLARATSGAEPVTTVPVGIELRTGELSETVSAQVGLRATPLSLTVTVPEGAADLVVRLIPQDRSIAVQERGRVVFERAVLAPADWPAQLTPDSLPLRRVLVVGYTLARGYTREPIAVTRRPAEEIAGAWRGLQEAERPLELQRRILAGELQIGMTRTDVRLAWGEPDGSADAGGLERWSWSDRSAAFAGDLLAGWTVQAAPPKATAAPCPAALPSPGES